MIKHQIVLVPFPFDDFHQKKVRPALCLTNEIGEHDHVVIAFISSKIPEKILSSDVLIRTNSGDWNDTGLIKDSVIRLHKLLSIPKYLIKRKLGKIGAETGDEVQSRIQQLFR